MAGEPLAGELLAGRADRQHFGMRRRVGKLAGAIAGCGHHCVAAGNDGTDGNFAAQGRRLRLFQRQRHEIRPLHAVSIPIISSPLSGDPVMERVNPNVGPDFRK